MSARQRGQVLAFFALVLPIVLLPVVAYAVDAAWLSSEAAGLQAATAQAVEVAADQVDVAALRAGGGLALDVVEVRAAVTAVLGAEAPAASLDSVTVTGPVVSIVASEQVKPSVPLVGGTFTLRARAAARLAPGYDRPSSHLALPVSTF